MERSLGDWLRWQEDLHPRWMELDLERVRQVAGRLAVPRPVGPVFTVAGTNGKGSTAAFLEGMLREAGFRTGLYTSPHLVRYNERVRVAGEPAADGSLVAAFSAVESARGDVPLTFFEYGTLGALRTFHEGGCDAWILEVGLGGRLDAVNIVEPDYSLITTIGLDHEEYLGDNIEQIAREKAGILRSGRPGFFGHQPVPRAILDAARTGGTPLRCLGSDFRWERHQDVWDFAGERARLCGIPLPPFATAVQFDNLALGLAALEQFDPSVIADPGRVGAVARASRPAGRFQLVSRRPDWVLDVAHNPQAAATLRRQLDTLPPAPLTVVLGMLGDKALDGFVAELAPLVARWVTATVDDPRARGGELIAARLRELGHGPVDSCPDPAAAFGRAAQVTPPDGRVLVCGSFRVVGPALQWLGLY
jgi:dihydrofolate synthase/folylpolyglutamate synthase